MEGDVFELAADIIELREKPVEPYGEFTDTPSGSNYEIKDQNHFVHTSIRAILDIGLLDINPKFLIPKDKQLKIKGAASDMLVIDLGKNPQNYKVGDQILFQVKYMGALHLLSSDYITKKLVTSESQQIENASQIALSVAQKGQIANYSV